MRCDSLMVQVVISQIDHESLGDGRAEVGWVVWAGGKSSKHSNTNGSAVP